MRFLTNTTVGVAAAGKHQHPPHPTCPRYLLGPLKGDFAKSLKSFLLARNLFIPRMFRACRAVKKGKSSAVYLATSGYEQGVLLEA